MSVHYAFGQQRNNKEKEVVSIVDSTERAEATSIESSNPYVSLVTELSPEDTEDGDLRQGPTQIANLTFQCEACDISFSTKTGLSQHERIGHPNIRNTKRIADLEKDIERERNAKAKSKELVEDRNYAQA